MANVYVSFLGRGAKSGPYGEYRYIPARYSFEGKTSSATAFVQQAELELLKPVTFDRVIIATTQKAADSHFGSLAKELAESGYENTELVILDEDMSTEGQWRWFEKLLDTVHDNDELTIDLTHGYRSIPIVFSTAINFLQKAKNIVLEHVLYGAFEQNRETVPIVDMKDFYSINFWAEAVERIVEDADTRKMAELSGAVPEYQVSRLADEDLMKQLEDLTNRFRSVDVNNIHYSAKRMLDLILAKTNQATKMEKLLFTLVLDKYSGLAGELSLTGEYSKDYFTVQLDLIKLFNEHKLYMQSFTAMREIVGSIGLIGIDNSRFDNKTGRRLRKKYAELFINMMQHKEEDWGFFKTDHPFYTPENNKHAEELMPFYNKLKELGIEKKLRNFVLEMTRYRNRLDHAWTEVKGFDEAVITKAPVYHEKLEQVVNTLIEEEILT